MEEEKLKTLKDIQSFEMKGEFSILKETKEIGFILYSKKQLRQEAIKIAKKIKEVMQDTTIAYPDLSKILPFCIPQDTATIPEWREHLGSIINFIKWWFNITEEELK